MGGTRDSPTGSDSGSNVDVEKRAHEHESAVHHEDVELSHSVTRGDAVVTLKTWAVVIVCHAPPSLS